MEFRKLTDALSVSPQISPADIDAVVEAGYKTIICNRPDGEVDDQPAFSAIEDAANKSGLVFINQPVSPRQVVAEDVSGFASNISSAQSPVLAYCRTGTRCTILWALGVSADGMPIDQILKIAADAGYDLTKQADYIASVAK